MGEMEEAGAPAEADFMAFAFPALLPEEAAALEEEAAELMCSEG